MRYSGETNLDCSSVLTLCTGTVSPPPQPVTYVAVPLLTDCCVWALVLYLMVCRCGDVRGVSLHGVDLESRNEGRRGWCRVASVPASPVLTYCLPPLLCTLLLCAGGFSLLRHVGCSGVQYSERERYKRGGGGALLLTSIVGVLRRSAQVK